MESREKEKTNEFAKNYEKEWKHYVKSFDKFLSEVFQHMRSTIAHTHLQASQKLQACTM